MRRGPDTVVVVFAADHRIKDRGALLRFCREAAVAAAAGAIVTFGIAPTRPATGFGYLRPGAPLASGEGRAPA